MHQQSWLLQNQKGGVFVGWCKEVVFVDRFTPVPDSVLARAAASTSVNSAVSEQEQVRWWGTG